MSLEKLNLNDLTGYYNNEKLIRETVTQIQKDFGEFSFEINFSGDRGTPYEELLNEMKPIIEGLISSHSKAFIPLLYRIDMSESEVRNCLMEMNSDGIEKLVEAIIKRELKKVLIRHYFKSR